MSQYRVQSQANGKPYVDVGPMGPDSIRPVITSDTGVWFFINEYTGPDRANFIALTGYPNTSINSKDNLLIGYPSQGSTEDYVIVPTTLDGAGGFVIILKKGTDLVWTVPGSSNGDETVQLQLTPLSSTRTAGVAREQVFQIQAS